MEARANAVIEFARRDLPRAVDKRGERASDPFVEQEDGGRKQDCRRDRRNPGDRDRDAVLSADFIGQLVETVDQVAGQLGDQLSKRFDLFAELADLRFAVQEPVGAIFIVIVLLDLAEQVIDLLETIALETIVVDADVGLLMVGIELLTVLFQGLAKLIELRAVLLTQQAVGVVVSLLGSGWEPDAAGDVVEPTSLFDLAEDHTKIGDVSIQLVGERQFGGSRAQSSDQAAIGIEAVICAGKQREHRRGQEP